MGMGKRNTTNPAAERFKPNRLFYSLLFACALALMLLCLLIPAERERWFTIVTGFSCGGLASVLVAWLIDEANCIRDARRAMQNSHALFRNLFSVFDNSLQLLILEVVKQLQEDVPRKWFEWIKCAMAQEKSNPELIGYYNRCLMIFFDDVAEQIIAIKGQEAVLLEAGIITDDDILALTTMLSICDLARTEYNSKQSDQELANQFAVRCSLLHATVGFSPSLRSINNKNVEPMMYRMTLQNKENQKTEEVPDKNSHSEGDPI